MTRLLITLALVLLVIPTRLMAADAPAAQAAQGWGDLSGAFVFDGRPEPTKEFVQAGIKIPDESLIVNSKTGAVANVIVFLLPPKDKPLLMHPSYDAIAKATIEWDLKDHRFSPHVRMLRTSQALKFVNKDNVGHHPKVDLMDNPPMQHFLPDAVWQEQRIAKAERLPAKVGDNIEPWLGGFLVLQDHPYMAVSDAQGKFTIKNLPVGEHTFRVWQEKLGYVKSVILSTGAADWPKGKLTTTVKQGANDLGKIRFGGKLFE